MATPTEPLQAFLRRQTADTLATLLLELAEAHPAVQQRLARLQLADRPDRLAAAFRKTLGGWRRQTRYLDYRASRGWAVELEAWLVQVERELLPRDPMATVDLVESFIESDEKFFERADDSGGAIGDAVRAACQLWLRAAARCETPPDAWPDRLMRLYSGGDYGGREVLLEQAGLLLSEPQLRAMVAGLEQRLDGAEPASGDGGDGEGGAHLEEWRVASALGLLSKALRDPDVHVRVTLRRSPRPNSMQKQHFVLAYLEADRPADAMRWLEDEAGWEADARGRLRAETLRRLGETAPAAAEQQRVFERTLAVHDYRTWLGHLAPREQASAHARARELAMDHDEPVGAAELLVELECWDEAEATLILEQARIDGSEYFRLVPLAASLEAQARCRGATVVLRALLESILAKAYAPAYGHAARYWHRLAALAQATPAGDLLPLMPHDEYVAAVRQRNARKTAFWAQVEKG